MDKFTIEFYERENGDIPVEEFLLGLDKKMRAKILGIMGILQEKGNQLREPYSKLLTMAYLKSEGKLEQIFPEFYISFIEGKIIFTNGFVKKTQKTPKSEIEKAKMYRSNYLERCEKIEKI